MIKLVLTDLDNTLIPHKPDEPFHAAAITDEGIAAIHALLDAGAHFGPVTGRDPSSMSETFRGDAAAYATGAYANGQLVCLDGETIHREWIPAESLQHASDVLDSESDGFLVFFDVEGDRPNWGVSRKYRLDDVDTQGMLRVSKLLPEVEGPSLKAIVRLQDEANTEALRDLLRSEVPELNFEMPSPTVPVIDVMPKGYGKRSAVRIIADALGIGMDEVATFGDADNDVSMLKAVPNSVAVANASELAKSTARWHIPDAMEGSVAKAMAQIAEATARGAMPAFMRGNSHLR